MSSTAWPRSLLRCRAIPTGPSPSRLAWRTPQRRLRGAHDVPALRRPRAGTPSVPACPRVAAPIRWHWLWRGGLGLLLAVALSPRVAAPQDETEAFYRGRTIRIIVGVAPGGGFDAYSRLLARHLGRHLAGFPAIVVENMPGAGSLIAANYLFKVAKPDALAVGNFIGGLFLGQALGQKGIEFDARRFEFLGAPAKNHVVCAFTRASGITSLDAWRAARAPVKMGGEAPGASTPDNATRVLGAALGLPVQLVSGYKGTAQIRLAAEAGELAGGCWGWDSIKATWRQALETGEVVVVLQAAPKAHPDLGQVPLAVDLARTEEARQLIELGIHADSAIVRSYTLPPGTPRTRVRALRQAFQDTLRDPAFLAEADKARLGVDPVSGDEVERIVNGFFSLEPAAMLRLRGVLFD